MELTFQLSEEDVLRAFLLNNKKAFLYNLPYYVTLVLFSILMGYYFLVLFLGYTTSLLPLLFLFLMIGFSLLNRYLFFPYTARNYYRTAPELQSPMRVEVDERGMEFTSDTSTTSIRWDQFHGWKEDDDTLLLYISTLTMHILPRRVFEDPGDYATLKGKIERHDLEYIQCPPRTMLSVGVYLVFSGFLVYSLVKIFW